MAAAPHGSASWTCTVHVSQQFLSLRRLTHAHIWLVYVPPNTTAVCQPLDRAFVRPFKAALGWYSARYIGREIQHHPDDVASITHSIAGMRSPGSRERGWSRAVPEVLCERPFPNKPVHSRTRTRSFGLSHGLCSVFPMFSDLFRTRMFERCQV